MQRRVFRHNEFLIQMTMPVSCVYIWSTGFRVIPSENISLWELKFFWNLQELRHSRIQFGFACVLLSNIFTAVTGWPWVDQSDCLNAHIMLFIGREKCKCKQTLAATDYGRPFLLGRWATDWIKTDWVDPISHLVDHFYLVCGWRTK